MIFLINGRGFNRVREGIIGVEVELTADVYAMALAWDRRPVVVVKRLGIEVDGCCDVHDDRGRCSVVK